jgi:hypothetical protein
MFLRHYTRRKGGRGICRINPDCCLSYEGPRVDASIHKVNGAAVEGIVGFKCSLMCLETWILWKQRGVYVDESAFESADKLWLYNHHKAGKGDNVGARSLRCFEYCGLIVSQVRKGVAGYDRKWDAKLSRMIETTRIRLVRYHPCDPIISLML